MLDFRMQTFLTVCKYMNYTRAAEELNVTQPTVSQHIRSLEEYYSVRLFCQNGKRMYITEAGSLLKSAATSMQHDEIYLKEKLCALPGKNMLVFGVTLTVGEYILPEAVAAYLLSRPEAKMKMVVSNTKELLLELDSGEIDFALVEGYFAKNEYDHMVFATEPYIAVCAPGYEFSQNPKTIEALLNERIIVREEGSGTREVLEKYLEEKNLTISDFSNIIEISDLCAIKKLTASGCGITFLYEAAVREELLAGSLKKIPLEDFNLSHDITFIFRRNSIFAEEYRALFFELHGGAGA